jgi:hypothetical protein
MQAKQYGVRFAVAMSLKRISAGVSQPAKEITGLVF